MLEHRPDRERVLATATFGGIALATILALDLLVTAGFDVAPPSAPSDYVDPFASALNDAERATPQGAVAAVALVDPMMLEETPPAEELAGNQNSEQLEAVANAAHVEAPSEDDLYREIEALYAAQDERAEAAAADRPSPQDVEPIHLEDAPALDKLEASAYETESPW